MTGGKGRGKGRGGKGAVFAASNRTDIFGDTQNNGKGGKKGKKDGGKKGGSKGKKAQQSAPGDVGEILALVTQKYGRYQSKLLDYSGLKGIEEIQKYNPNMNNDMWSQLVVKMLKRSDYSDVSGLTLDKNNIKTLYHFADQCGKNRVQLHSLSVQDNNIASFDEIKRLAPLRLRHLYIRGNPIAKASGEKLLKAMQRMLPTLQRLDDTDLDRSNALDNVPQPMPGGIDLSLPHHQMVQQFMEEYYMGIEGNSVDGLMDMYETKACLSLTTDPTNLDLGYAGQQFAARMKDKEHNVVTNPNRTNTLAVGKIEVGKTLEVLQKGASLKKVEYDRDALLKNTEIAMFEQNVLGGMGLQIPQLLSVTSHGVVTYQFVLKSKMFSFKKYFDRTWLLTLRPSGKLGILNDTLHIRNASKDQKEPVFTPAENSTKGCYSVHMKQEDDKIIRVCSTTKLKPDFARFLLTHEETNWDLEKAGQHFVTSQQAGQLNESHFMSAEESVPTSIALQIFCQRTRLTPQFATMCLSNPEVNYDLWMGWLLFKEKEALLTPDCYQQ